MKEATRFVTFDGKEHRTQQLAERYLDNLYANLILKLSHRMIGNLNSVSTAIDKNLELFVELKQIKDDKEVER